MKITIHGHLVPITENQAGAARDRMVLALGTYASSVKVVTVRLVQTYRFRPPQWVSVVDLGQQGTVITRADASDRLAGLVELARRSAESVAHRLSGAAPSRSSARVRAQPSASARARR